MKKDGRAGTIHKAYWKSAIWLMAGISLLTLFAMQIWSLQVKVEHICIGVVFSLLFSICFTLLLNKMEGNGGANAMRVFLAYATARLLSALAVIASFMALTGQRGRQMMPFVLLFATYFILLDALDAAYMVKVMKVQQQEE
ncbi:MAG: hypothetical protein IKI26_07315 [Prevotella sp.]|nr:hypothetical protein [Prevotella sp.]